MGLTGREAQGRAEELDRHQGPEPVLLEGGVWEWGRAQEGRCWRRGWSPAGAQEVGRAKAPLGDGEGKAQRPPSEDTLLRHCPTVHSMLWCLLLQSENSQTIILR